MIDAHDHGIQDATLSAGGAGLSFGLQFSLCLPGS
jgi:hypothetical protein